MFATRSRSVQCGLAGARLSLGGVGRAVGLACPRVACRAVGVGRGAVASFRRGCGSSDIER
eukprot:10548585-Lingulodinium_polyedra.AAC.1